GRGLASFGRGRWRPLRRRPGEARRRTLDASDAADMSGDDQGVFLERGLHDRLAAGPHAIAVRPGHDPIRLLDLHVVVDQIAYTVEHLAAGFHPYRLMAARFARRGDDADAAAEVAVAVDQI